jgi:c-di-GMP-binding flagellar brake protein YcgR
MEGMAMPGVNIVLGSKIELTHANRKKNENSEGVTYVSQVQDSWRTEEGIVVRALMPIREGHIVPLDVGTSYKMYFYMNDIIYEGTGKIIDRFREINIYYMDLLLEKDVVKVQRREYYRLPCDMDVEVMELGFEEVLSCKANHKLPNFEIERTTVGRLVDISGNGLKFKSVQRYERDAWVVVRIGIRLSDTDRLLVTAGKVIESFRDENTDDYFVTRIQFKEMDKKIKDLVVKFIFKEQTRIQQKQRNL